METLSIEDEVQEVRARRLTGREARDVIASKINLRALKAELSRDPFLAREGTMEAIARLVLELGPKLQEYETVLSDDASGRLVSLLLWKVINKKRRAVGLKSADICFIAGGYRGDLSEYDGKSKRAPALTEFINSKKASLGQVLLVTEYIHSGRSIKNLIEMLEECGAMFDLASVSINKNPEEYPSKIRNRLYYGAIGDEGMSFYGKPFIAGVEKTGESLVHPVAAREAMLDNPGAVPRSRAEVNLIADELIKLVD